MHQKSIERSPARSVVYTRYGSGLVLEKHSHEAIHILEGELMVGDVRCKPGTTIVLETGTPFGPLIAGPGRAGDEVPVAVAAFSGINGPGMGL